MLLEGMREVGGALLPDLVSYNTCIKACGQAAMVTEAMQVMPSRPSYNETNLQQCP